MARHHLIFRIASKAFAWQGRCLLTLKFHWIMVDVIIFTYAVRCKDGARFSILSICKEKLCIKGTDQRPHMKAVQVFTWEKIPPCYYLEHRHLVLKILDWFYRACLRPESRYSKSGWVNMTSEFSLIEYTWSTNLWDHPRYLISNNYDDHNPLICGPQT